MTRVSKKEALHALREGLGEEAGFRDQQWEAIDRLVNDRDRLLLVQRTGWGKSWVYFVATRLLRDQGAGPTLLVSPLLSLMDDQIRAAREKLGLQALKIDSTNRDEWDYVKGRILDGSCDLLLVSPERLSKESFREQVMEAMELGFGMFVVDEAHCISDWGHDFRPDYRRIRRIVERLPENVPVLATTATANERVVEDVKKQLRGMDVLRGPLVRRSLHLQAIEMPDPQRRLAWLAENVPELPGSGIIYCLTTTDAERVASFLQKQGIDALAYHSRGDIPEEEKQRREERLRENHLKALVATRSLGMGYDKDDIGFVVHFQRPQSLVHYYQEVGRAGRDIDDAYAILLEGEEDDDIAEYFIEQAFPRPDQLNAVLDVIDGAEEGLSLTEIQTRVDIRRNRLRKGLKFLHVDGAITKDGRYYVRTAKPWSYDHERAREVTERRYGELEQVKRFVRTDGCSMRFVVGALDGDMDEDCGRCANCKGNLLPTQVARESVLAAIDHYRSDGWEEIDPRTRRYLEPEADRSFHVIPEEERIETGRVLSSYGDPGWGSLVEEGKYKGDVFDEELVEAAVELIRERWSPEPGPTWVTAVASTDSGDLVPDLARRIADRLGLPFHDVVDKVRETRPQKEMKNTHHKSLNVKDAFDIDEDPPEGPVLLVDDIVGSGCTLAEVGRTLRRAGAGPVHPFALAKRRG